eukprot:177787-Chlamydomonas_euryale.AAC.6
MVSTVRSAQEQPSLSPVLAEGLSSCYIGHHRCAPRRALSRAEVRRGAQLGATAALRRPPTHPRRRPTRLTSMDGQTSGPRSHAREQRE